MKTLNDVLVELRQMKARWVDPEEVDDGEDLILEAVQFIEAATPVVEEHTKALDAFVAYINREAHLGAGADRFPPGLIDKLRELGLVR